MTYKVGDFVVLLEASEAEYGDWYRHRSFVARIVKIGALSQRDVLVIMWPDKETSNALEDKIRLATPDEIATMRRSNRTSQILREKFSWMK